MSVLSVSQPPGPADASGSGFPSRSGLRWIVCAGATRDVSRGHVKCPQRGIVNAKECLGCHLLVTIAHERDLRLACSTAG
jgi:hypothetical protein